jgi:hypothetical protein
MIVSDPKDKVLKKEVLESEHNFKIAGHQGQDKTLKIIQPNRFRPEIKEDIHNYVEVRPDSEITQNPKKLGPQDVSK